MRCHLVLTFALTLAAACQASPPGAAATDEVSSPVFIPTLPAAPLIGWQFRECLTPDQRAALIAGLQDLYQRTPEFAPLRGTVGDSQCRDGEEKGGLFGSGWTSGQRLRGLVLMAIRPPARRFAFEIHHAAVDAVALLPWRSGVPSHRFDAGGYEASDGRYEIIDWTRYHALMGNEAFAVIDRQTQFHVDLYIDSFLGIGGSGQLYCGWSPNEVWPLGSDDPDQQRAIDAVHHLIPSTFDSPYMFVLWGHTSGSACRVLDFDKCPLLQGWPLAFSEVNVDEVANLILAGG